MNQARHLHEQSAILGEHELRHVCLRLHMGCFQFAGNLVVHDDKVCLLLNPSH